MGDARCATSDVFPIQGFPGVACVLSGTESKGDLLVHRLEVGFECLTDVRNGGAVLNP